MKRMFTDKQIDNISKFLWDIGKATFAGGVISGIMMQAVQFWKVLLAFVAAFGFALFAFLIDSIPADESSDKDPP